MGKKEKKNNCGSMKIYKIIICFILLSGLFFSCAKNENDGNSIKKQEDAPVSENSFGNIFIRWR
jgi:hypothetical protein